MAISLSVIVPLVNFGDVVLEWLLRVGTSFCDNTLSLLLTGFVSISKISTALFNTPIVNDAVSYAQSLGTVLLALKLIADIYKNYVATMAGDDPHPVSGYIVRGISALLVIWTTPWIIGQLVEIGNRVSMDVAGISGDAATPTSFVGALKQTFVAVANNIVSAEFLVFFGSLFSLFIGICLIIITFQMAKRSVEICLMAVIGPVLTISLAGEDATPYKTWFRHLIILCGSQGLQILVLRITFWAVTNAADLALSTGPMVILIGFALLLFCIKAPKFLEQFSYGAGNGQGRAGAAGIASSVINVASRAAK